MNDVIRPNKSLNVINNNLNYVDDSKQVNKPNIEGDFAKLEVNFNRDNKVKKSKPLDKQKDADDFMAQILNPSKNKSKKTEKPKVKNVIDDNRMERMAQLYRKDRRKDIVSDTSELVSAILNLDMGAGITQNLQRQIDVHEHIIQNNLQKKYDSNLVIQTTFVNQED